MFATDRASRMKGYPQIEAINSGVNLFKADQQSKVPGLFHSRFLTNFRYLKSPDFS